MAVFTNAISLTRSSAALQDNGSHMKLLVSTWSAYLQQHYLNISLHEVGLLRQWYREKATLETRKFLLSGQSTIIW